MKRIQTLQPWSEAICVRFGMGNDSMLTYYEACENGATSPAFRTKKWSNLAGQLRETVAIRGRVGKSERV